MGTVTNLCDHVCEHVSDLGADGTTACACTYKKCVLCCEGVSVQACAKGCVVIFVATGVCGHCGLACSAQGPLPAFEGESDSRPLAGLPCGIYFCLGADRRPE